MTPASLIDPNAKRKSVLEAMRASAPTTDTSVPDTQVTPTRVNIGSNGSLTGFPALSNIEAPEGPVNPTEYKTPPIKVRLGANTEGLSPIDKSIANLDVERQAARDFPGAKVRDGEILPPKMHHGFKDTLKSIGKGALISMGEYARTHPGASGAELLSAGTAGGITGGVSPVTIDKTLANAAIDRHAAELDQQLGLEKDRAQIGDIYSQAAQRSRGPNERPIYENRVDEDGNEIRQQYNQQTRKLEDVIGPDGNPVIVKRKPAVKPPAQRAPLLKERKNADGTTSTLKSTDNGETWAEVKDLTSAAPPEKPDKPTADNAQLAEWNYKKQHEAEAAAKDLRQQAASQDLTTYAGQKAQEDLLKRAQDADQNALKYRDEGDRAAVKPRAVTRGAGPVPTKGKIHLGKWKADHPGENFNSWLADMKRRYPNASVEDY